MTIGLMTICDWAAASGRDTDVAQPSWDDVERAIRALDGRARNDLYLYPDANDHGTWLCVGDGHGRYILTGGIGIDLEFPTLVESGRPAIPEEALVVGGQERIFPANWVVSLDVALSGARAFYDAGGFGTNFPWGRGERWL
jgi:immunity protein Imm1 of predicted polymorphic toxin system